LEIILKAWTEPSFSYHGSFYSVPPKWLPWDSAVTRGYFSQSGIERRLQDVIETRDGQDYLKELSVYPQPLQKPYPQIWQTALGTNSVRAAARRGFNVCHLGAGGDQVRQVLEAYHTESEKAGWPDRSNRGSFRFGWDSERKRGVSFLRFIHIGEVTPERRSGLFHFPNYIANSLISGVHLPHGVRLTGEFFDDNGMMLHGSKQQVIDGLMRDYQMGFEDYLTLPIFETPGLTAKEIEEQMHLFAEEVMPVLQAECGGSPKSEPPLEVPSD
jgi:alkanesulfonate monooxygenase SsuD/methylene tetrahydromethanopterin reductase-like flavin-dependent oxidoreductase (luciferase family)